MNIYEELKAAGVPLSNWCSDLYVEVNDQTTTIISKYEYKQNITKFRCEITGQATYEIPFAYNYKKLGDL